MSSTSPLRAIGSVLAFLAVASTATADEVAGPQNASNALAQPMHRNLACASPVNGAVEGEAIEARIARLETALRLARAEKRVNGRRK